MGREQIEAKLRIPILNVCLAAAAGREDDLREAKTYLLDAIEKMVRRTNEDAINERLGDLRA